MPASTSSSAPTPEIWTLILAGGVGSRFWPVSTAARPKQVLPLGGDRPLIQDAVRRAETLSPPDRIRILTGARLEDVIRDAVPGLPPDSLLLEPRARGTAPVLAWAAWQIARSNPEATLVSLHADHVITPQAAFTALLSDAARLAVREDLLLTVAIPPTRPDPGFGYIRPGPGLEPEGSAEGFRVDAFVEKPDSETAARYVEAGYLWNSGIFVWSARRFLAEVEAVAPEIAGRLPLLEEGDVQGFFDRCPAITVDEAVMERSERVGTVRATFEWDDVGSWEALSRTRPADGDGNVAVGRVHAIESSGTIAYADDGAIVLFGVHDLIAVRTGTVTLVLPRDRGTEMKALLARLPADPAGPGPSEGGGR